MRYAFDVRCPYDGAEAVHVASGTTNGWQTRSVARCTCCGTDLLLELSVTAPNGGRRATPAKRAAIEHARNSKKVNA